MNVEQFRVIIERAQLEHCTKLMQDPLTQVILALLEPIERPLVQACFEEIHKAGFYHALKTMKICLDEDKAQREAAAAVEKARTSGASQ